MSEKFLTTKDICHRYGVVSRTVDRWVTQGVLEQPTRINGRRYWRLSAIEQNERDAVPSRQGTDPATCLLPVKRKPRFTGGRLTLAARSRDRSRKSPVGFVQPRQYEPDRD